MSIHLTESQFIRQINEWLPGSRNRDLCFLQISQGKNVSPLDIKTPTDIYQSKYTGTIIIKNRREIDDTPSPHAADEIDVISVSNAVPNAQEIALTQVSEAVPIAQEMEDLLFFLIAQEIEDLLFSNVTVEIDATLVSQENDDTLHSNGTGEIDDHLVSNPSPITQEIVDPLVSDAVPITPESSRVTREEENFDLPFELRTPSDINFARDMFLSQLTEKQEFLVDRSKRFEQAVTLYQDESIMSCTLYIRFNNEEGDDFDGLTREFFSVFWERFFDKYCRGHTLKYIYLMPENIPPLPLCMAAGRILLHGFILTRFVPININAFFKAFSPVEESFFKRELFSSRKRLQCFIR